MVDFDPNPRLTPLLRLWPWMAAAACLTPLLLQLPPRFGIGIGASAIVLWWLAWRGTIPAALRMLLLMLMVGGVLIGARFAIGRDTACAMLAAMIALKPVEVFTPRDARSLIGFALFAPFATFLLDQGPVSLLLGLFAALVGLLALQRITDHVSGIAHTSHRTDLMRVLRLAAFGLPLALAAFWLFPRLATPLWGVPDRALSRPGLSDSMAPGGWLDMMTDDTPALRVQFHGATPSTSQMYWRGPVLWEFDGRTWTRPRSVLRDLPSVPQRHAATRWDYTLEQEASDRHEVLALESVLDAPEQTLQGPDDTIYSMQPLISLKRWRLQSAPMAETNAVLPSVVREHALQLPTELNPRTVQLARQWRLQTGKDDAAIVQRALDMIRAEFAYTLTTPLPGRHGVDEFLFDQKAGYCEHFSSSFTFLMRAAGIPARVVTGYVGGVRMPMGDYWLVRRSDAHAWSEVWLQGRGWVRVDPTAAVAPERIYDTLADRVPGAVGGFTGLTGVFQLGDWMRRGWNDLMLGFNAASQQNLLRRLQMERFGERGLMLLFSLVAGASLAWMLWLASRAERERDPLLRAWRRLDARYARLGYPRKPHEPALAWAQRIVQMDPGHAALLPLIERLANWRYAGISASKDAANALIRDLNAHRPQLN